MTKDEAIKALHECSECKRWIVARGDGPEHCDHCCVDAHRCPSTPTEAAALLQWAIELGRKAERLRARMAALMR